MKTTRAAGAARRSLIAVTLAVVAAAVISLANPLAHGACAKSFTDVRADDWFRPAVEALADQGVIFGYADGTFHPYNPVTRAQFASMLAATLRLPPSHSSPFVDVRPSDWFAGAANALFDIGIVQGGGDGLFAPALELERQQAATLIVRGLAYRNTNPSETPVDLLTGDSVAAVWLGGFKDRGYIGPGHALPVANAVRLGFISGHVDARFYPFVTITRAQAAGMLYASLGDPVPQPRMDAPAQVEAEAGYPTLQPGAVGPLVTWVERRLAALSYRPGSLDGKVDVNTSDAVMGFQKYEGLPRTGAASDSVIRRLASATKPAPRKSAGGRRVEVDLTRQVLLLINGGSVEATIPCASGRAGLRTPTGVFSVERKLPYWRRSDLGLLYKPAYFIGGYAIHGSYSVPPQPASHGCVRVAVATMDWLYPLLPIGTRVDVYY